MSIIKNTSMGYVSPSLEGRREMSVGCDNGSFSSPKEYCIAAHRGWVSILILLCLTLPASAQGTAEVWLNKAVSQFQNKGVEVSFRLNEEGFPLTGKLLMEGDSYHFDTEEMKVWFDGTTQWTMQYADDYSDLYINTPTIEEQQSINPYLLLKHYKEHFTAQDGSEKTIAGKPVHEVILTAKDNQQALTGLRVYIKSDGHIAALTLIFPDEREYKIEVRSMRNGLTFPKQTFTYSEKAFPADEVIDMR